jgi:selenoprotein W-related protein
MAARPIKVTIAYCSECGYEPQTVELAQALMVAFRHELSEIELIPWVDGSFDVTVDGELVHSMYREGGFPDPQVVIEAVRHHQAGEPAAIAAAPETIGK